MISGEQLQDILCRINTYPDIGTVWAQDTIRSLVREVRRLQAELASEHEERSHFAECHYIEQQKNIRLEKEADWLAKKASAHSPCIDPHFDCLAADQLNQCHICWREAARKAVKNDK